MSDAKDTPAGPSADLNDLEVKIGNMSHLLDTIVDNLLEAQRDPFSLERAIALSIIARDMNDGMIDEMAACHLAVLNERPAKARATA